jgi:hypothetical protein
MAKDLRDTKAYKTASKGYNQAFKVGKDVYKASKPYRSPGKSIIAAAKGNLFEFPVFISSSVQLDYATATTSLLEQVYASYVQIALSLNPVVDSSLVKNKTPFAQFQSDTNRYVEYTEMDYAHDAVHNEVEMEDGSVLEYNIMSIEDADGKVILEQYNKRPLSEFDHFFQEAQDSSYNNEQYARDAANQIEDQIQQIRNSRDDIQQQQQLLGNSWQRLHDAQDRVRDREDEIQQREQQLRQQIRDHNHDVRQRAEHERRLNQLRTETRALKAERERLSRLEEQLNQTEKEYNLERHKAAESMRHNKATEKETERHNKADEENKRKQLRHQIVKDRHDQKQHEKDWERELNFKYTVKQPEMLDETKIKKLNTMKPLMMNVSFNVMADDGHLSQAVNYVVGVKTFNRIVDADTLPEVAEYPLKEMNKIARKAKWRAGELKFFRDIVFKIKQKKQTAVDASNPKRRWYRRLYELAHMRGDAPAKAVMNGKNIAWSVVKSQVEQDFDFGIIPNASLIISASDVTNIKAKTGIDLLKGSSAKKLCKELFMIAFVVIDTDAESIKILLPDNHDDFEVHSLASVNKQLAELSTAGSKTRDIFKLLG